MKLLTETMIDQLKKNHRFTLDNNGNTVEDAVCKLFMPTGGYTFFVFDGYQDNESGDFVLYGFVIMDAGPCGGEWGYASLREIESIRDQFGLRVERDRHFRGITRTTINTELCR